MNGIETTAEAEESAVLPRIREVHTDPGRNAPCDETLPAALKKPTETKSAARWAYERLILYIRNFEKQLDSQHEVAMGFTGGDAGVIRIEGMGYFDPDIVTFYGADPSGTKTQLIQHVTQLNVLLRALPKQMDAPVARRIGFALGSEIDDDAAAVPGASGAAYPNDAPDKNDAPDPNASPSPAPDDAGKT